MVVGGVVYIYGPSDEPVEQIALGSSTPTYLTYTASDDTWLTTNQAGDETGYWAYDAYGNLSFGTPTSPFGYSGQFTDSTTGFVNDRARRYEPADGGFTTRDPDFSDTDNAYGYANDDPANTSDASGESPTPLHQYFDIVGCCGPILEAMAYLIHPEWLNLAPVTAAAIVGNLDVESGLNPACIQSFIYSHCVAATPDQNSLNPSSYINPNWPGMGIAQWGGSRVHNLLAFGAYFFGDDNWSQLSHNLGAQLHFVVYEFSTTYSGVLKVTESDGNNISQATTNIERNYEGPQPWQPSNPARIADAEAALSAWNNQR